MSLIKKIDKDLKEKIIGLLKQNDKVQAVFITQKTLQLGLKNSKDIVDKIEQELI